MGLSYSFVTASFYDKDDDTDKNFNNKTVTLPEIQVVLLVTGMMYIILGSFLEYIRHIEIRIIIPIISLFGILKIIVRTHLIFSKSTVRLEFMTSLWILTLKKW